MCKPDDSVILAVKTLENSLKLTKYDTREQLSKSNLVSICSYCNNIMRVLKDVSDNKLNTVKLLLVGVGELADSYYKSETFVQTDSETKNYIYEKLSLALDELYLFASEFYLERDFSYNVRIEPILNRIIDRRLREDIEFFG